MIMGYIFLFLFTSNNFYLFINFIYTGTTSLKNKEKAKITMESHKMESYEAIKCILKKNLE